MILLDYWYYAQAMSINVALDMTNDTVYSIQDVMYTDHKQSLIVC